jgi:large subunit ribosomal protein L3
MQGLLGKKIGMTRVFDADGQQVPVTVLEVGPCVVVQCKNRDGDGYAAAQLGFVEQKESRVDKPHLGHFKKAACAPMRYLHEFEMESGEEVKVGDRLTAAMFEGAEFVDITGLTKGKGFQGVVRRHGMSGGPITHGGHSKRRVGSIGCRSYPGRVHKNKRMPGHQGNIRITQQNLKVVQVRGTDNLLLVRGAVPGPKGAVLVIRRSIKKAKRAS